MKKLQLSLCAVGAYLVLIGAFALFGSRPATGQGSGLPPGPDVRVINKPSQPVPVTGQVNIGSLPAVQLDTTQPIPVTAVGQPALRPFGKSVLVFTSFDQSSESFTVPADKRLYIETVSVSGSIPKGQIPSTHVELTTGGEKIIHPLPVTFNTFDGVLSDTYHGLHEVRMVADPGTTVTFRAWRPASGGTMALGFTVSGHLADLQ